MRQKNKESNCQHDTCCNTLPYGETALYADSSYSPRSKLSQLEVVGFRTVERGKLAKASLNGLREKKLLLILHILSIS